MGMLDLSTVSSNTHVSIEDHAAKCAELGYPLMIRLLLEDFMLCRVGMPVRFSDGTRGKVTALISPEDYNTFRRQAYGNAGTDHLPAVAISVD